MNFNKKKLLIYIVTFNHEKFIVDVLNRIPKKLSETYEVEILINDDSSSDSTFKLTYNFIENLKSNFKFKIFSNPKNQGYGGNQKIGYHYAIKNNFDYVALLHGDGQYAPEYLENLVEPLNSNEVDAVFGSRMLTKGAALKGGMPLYKFIGNKILTNFQNFLLSSKLSEFHSGYRVYKVGALKKIPFELNANDYSFDSEIIIQLIISKLKIKELPIPTYYGDEISYVNGFKYAYQICIATLKSQLQKKGLFYDRKFDTKNESKNLYVNKENFYSTHSEILKKIEKNSKILDIGCNDGYISNLLKTKKNCYVVGVDKKTDANNLNLDNFINHDLNTGLPEIDYKKFDYIILLDVIEHLNDPEGFIDQLKKKISDNENIKIIISTPNIAFFVMRIMLLIGNFNYGKRGILDKTHTRLFTFSTLKYLLLQSGFSIIEKTGIPAPYPLAIGENFLSKLLLEINFLLIKISKTIFSYQIMYTITPNISLDTLMNKADEESIKKIKEI
jgi:GT2 family glycosyltransferase/2-polyprenyl-3-methyl-5-hydroxy-6-metoxy-1,4-benzoquinol methylase